MLAESNPVLQHPQQLRPQHHSMQCKRLICTASQPFDKTPKQTFEAPKCTPSCPLLSVPVQVWGVEGTPLADVGRYPLILLRAVNRPLLPEIHLAILNAALNPLHMALISTSASD